MYKLTFAALVLLFSASAVLADDSAEERKTESEGPAYRLVWNFAKGEKLQYRDTQITKQAMDYGVFEMETLNENITDSTVECLGFTEDGAVQLKYTYDRIALVVKTEGVEVKYDSATDELDVLDEMPELKGTASLVGESFTYEVTVELEVRNLKGWDKIREKVLKDFDDESRESMEPSYTDEARKNQLEAGLRSLPRKQVKIGDKWTNSHTEDAGLVGKMTYAFDLSLKSVEKDDESEIAEIEYTAKVELKVFKDGPFAEMDIKLAEQDVKGTDRFDLKRGCMIGQKSAQKLVITIDVEGMSIKQVLTVTTSIDLLEEAKDEDEDTVKDE